MSIPTDDAKQCARRWASIRAEGHSSEARAARALPWALDRVAELESEVAALRAVVNAPGLATEAPQIRTALDALEAHDAERAKGESDGPV